MSRDLFFLQGKPLELQPTQHMKVSQSQPIQGRNSYVSHHKSWNNRPCHFWQASLSITPPLRGFSQFVDCMKMYNLMYLIYSISLIWPNANVVIPTQSYLSINMCMGPITFDLKWNPTKWNPTRTWVNVEIEDWSHLIPFNIYKAGPKYFLSEHVEIEESNWSILGEWRCDILDGDRGWTRGG